MLASPSRPKYRGNDPARYDVKRSAGGDYQVIDLNTGKPIASQMDSREEAQGWIAEQLIR